MDLNKFHLLLVKRFDVKEDVGIQDIIYAIARYIAICKLMMK